MWTRRCGDRGNSVWAWMVTSTEASQILEFAISLPLLVVLVVGIFDFGGAFNLKHQLRNAVRQGARYASSLPISDITGATLPGSVGGAWSVVDSYLVRSQINDCNLGSTAPTSASSYVWTYNAAGCPGPLILKIERAYVINAVINSNSTDVICTRLSIVYPYPWHFNRVIQLLVPGTSYGGTLQIAADAVMPNME
jgi:TadE-like protein